MIKLYLGCVIIAKAYTKISNPYVFENFQAEVGAFRTKVVEVIIGDSDSIKSCKTEKKQRLIPCLPSLPFPSTTISSEIRNWYNAKENEIPSQARQGQQHDHDFA